MGEKVKFRLTEDILNEAVVPSYRDMFLNLLQFVTDNKELKDLLNNQSFRDQIELHHIDRDYDKFKKYGVTYYKAKNNSHNNIAIMPKDAHKLITRNRRSIEEVAKEYPVYFLRDCVPNWFTSQVEKELVGGKV